MLDAFGQRTMFRFPVPPIVLGVILAALADENLRRSVLVFEDKSLGFVLSQWIGTLLMAFVLFAVVEGILRGLRSARRTQPPRAAQERERTPDVSPSERKEIGLAIGCGTIGRIRAELARAHPGIGWIGLGLRVRTRGMIGSWNVGISPQRVISRAGRQSG